MKKITRPKIPGLNASVLKRAFLTLLVIPALFLAGTYVCAQEDGQQPRATFISSGPAKAATTAASQPQSKAVVERPIAQNPQPSLSGASPVTVRNEKDRTVVGFPLPQGIDVSPDLQGRDLMLNFSAPAPSFALPPVSDGQLARRFDYIPSSEPGKISGLKLGLAVDSCKFMLLREGAGSMSVVLATPPGTTRDITGAVNVSKMIENIDFSHDAGSVVYIKVKGEGDLDFKTLDGESGQLSLWFPGHFAPSNLAKAYSLKKFGGNVKSAWLHNIPNGARLDLTVAGRAPWNVERKPGLLIFKFPPAERGTAAGKGAHDDSDASADGDETTNIPGLKKKYSGSPISIDVQDADIEHVLRLISEVSGHNMVIDDKVAGKISLKLKNVPWDQVLDVVLLQKNLSMARKGNLIRITTNQAMNEERKQLNDIREATIKAQESRLKLEPLMTEEIQINYTKAKRLTEMVKDNLTKERGKATVDEETNKIFITDTERQVRTLKGLIQRLDQPQRQVMIEARIVYATDDFQRGLGVQWGGSVSHQSQTWGSYGWGLEETGNLDAMYPKYWDNMPFSEIPGYAVNLPLALTIPPTMGIGGSFVKGFGDFLFALDAKLRLAESKGEAKTVSSPKVVTMNLKQAKILQGIQIPYQTASDKGTNIEFKPANLELTVTPQITPNNKFILNLVIKDDSKGQMVGTTFAIDTKSIETSLMVDDGETVVIGGVQKYQESETLNKVPFLGDIPFFGWLFKSKSNTNQKIELLIFIRPKII